MTESISTPFHDLDAYIDLPRGSGLALSPDGARLVTAVATLNPKRTKYVTALWEVDPTGERPARRLTRSAKGEGGAVFLPDGSLMFTSARPDPDAKEEDDDEVALLWLLPAPSAHGTPKALGCMRPRIAVSSNSSPCTSMPFIKIESRSVSLAGMPMTA